MVARATTVGLAICLLLAGCSQSPVGLWGITDPPYELNMASDNSFTLRTPGSVLVGTWKLTTSNHFILSLANSPVGMPGCFTNDSVRVQDGGRMMTFNRKNSDGTFQSRVTSTTITDTDGRSTTSSNDCTP